MTDYTGSALYCTWVYSGGTLVLSTDYRSLATAPTIALVDASAGADTDRTYLTTLKDGTYQYAGVHQTYSTGGSAVANALVEGTSGTLIIGPEGTATGKPKETVPAISMGGQFTYPYDGIVEVSCQFQKNGARTLSVY